MFLSILSDLLKAICAYFQLKNTSFYYDILEKSREKQESFEKEIERLRDKGDPKSSDLADLLLLRLLEERKWMENISNSYSPIKKGDKGSV